MQNLPKDKRSMPLLVVAFLLAIFFLSLSQSRLHRARWYEQAVYNLIYPFQISINLISSKIGNAWDHYIHISDVSYYNEKYEKLISEQFLKINILEEGLQRFRNLEKLSGYVADRDFQYQVARVISNDPRSEFKTVIINKGHKDGIKINSAVLADGGLIGKVAKVDNSTATVLLITDPNNYIDIFVQRSRARALLVGTARKTVLRPSFYLSRLEYLRRISDIHTNDVIVTSGLDQVYPKGIPIGEVISIEADEYGIFKEANILPFADISHLEEVLIVINADSHGYER